jgi:hypothetical protein
MSRKTAIVTLFTGIVCGVAIGITGSKVMRGKSGCVVVRDTTTVRDTVCYTLPAASDSARTKYITRYLPLVKRDTLFAEMNDQDNGDFIPSVQLSDDRDSASVEIPITQKRYDGADYCAYVSGYEASLDSIFVYTRTTTIKERGSKPPDKWHIGITGGYGITPKGLRPYVGIGLTYSLISF